MTVVEPQIGQERVEAILAQVPLFHSLPSQELQYLADHLRAIDLPSGALLFREGERGEHFYVVLQGLVEIVKALDTGEARLLGQRGPGEFFGEMSLFDLEGLRTASVRTALPSRFLEMSRQELDALLSRQPRLAYQMVRVLSVRLKDSENESIRDLKAKNQLLQEAYDDLKAAQAELVEKEKLERELQLARDIQMSVLPEALPAVEGYDFGALIAPARAVGGDFYNVFPVGRNRIGVLVGDVTDKGVPAAIFMAQTHALLQSEASHGRSPRDTLLRVNHQLLRMNARGMFATVLYGVLDSRSGEFCYSRAGHELPLLCLEGEVTLPPRGAGQPLGILPRPELDQQTLSLPQGSTLLLYTDGVTDTTGPQAGAFGLPRLQQALIGASAYSAQACCDNIFRALQTYQAHEAQFDDITLVAVKYLAG
jgi:sigma-B regulation protein RsbU (phosphoserine phosphatase)